jgi:NADPH-dependent curcumin reductase CurA
MATHRAWRLRSRPVGQIKDTDLKLCTEPKPVAKPGSLLVRNLFVSLDPTHRIWMSDRPQVRTVAPTSLPPLLSSFT